MLTRPSENIFNPSHYTCNYACKKVSKSIRILYKLKYLLLLSCLKMLYCSLLLAIYTLYLAIKFVSIVQYNLYFFSLNS